MTHKVETDGYRAMLGRMLRAYTRRVGEGDIAELSGMAAFAADADAALVDTVHRLRSTAGGAYSWAQIGDALGITRQAAQKRFGGAGARTTGGQPSNLR